MLLLGLVIRRDSEMVHSANRTFRAAFANQKGTLTPINPILINFNFRAKFANITICQLGLVNPARSLRKR
jgi:hypothetical protein